MWPCLWTGSWKAAGGSPWVSPWHQSTSQLSAFMIHWGIWRFFFPQKNLITHSRCLRRGRAEIRRGKTLIRKQLVIFKSIPSSSLPKINHWWVPLAGFQVAATVSILSAIVFDRGTKWSIRLGRQRTQKRNRERKITRMYMKKKYHLRFPVCHTPLWYLKSWLCWLWLCCS